MIRFTPNPENRAAAMNGQSTIDNPSDSKITLALLFVFLLGSFGYVFHADPWDNALNRLDLAYSIVYHHSLNIDSYYQNTADKAHYKGHRYNSEAVGTVIPAAALLFVYRHVARDDNPDPFNPMPLYLITFFVVSLPSALLGTLLFCWLARFTPSIIDRLAVTLAFSFGTLALPYSTLFYSYMPALLLCFAAFLLIERGPGKREAAASGFLLGSAFITSYDTLLIAGPMAVYFIATLFTNSKDEAPLFQIAGRRFPRQRLSPPFLFMLGALPPALLLMSYNAACFGGPFDFGLFHLENPEWTARSREFLTTPMRPNMSRLLNLLLRPGYGLFWISPFLLIGIYGYARMIRRPELRTRGLLFVSIPLCYLLATSSFYNWRGGAGPGPRYLTASLLFLCAPAIFALRKPFLRPLFATLAAASIFLMSVATLTSPHAPGAVRGPVLGYCLPLLLQGYTAWNFGHSLGLRGIASTLPWFAFAACFVAALIAANRERLRDEFRNRPRNGAIAWTAAILAAAALLFATLRLSDIDAYHAAMLRAYYLNNHQMPAAAMSEYNLALRKRPGDPEALLQRAGIRIAAGDLEGALADCRTLLRKHPRNALAQFNASRILQQLDRAAEAECELDLVLSARTAKDIEFKARLARGTLRLNRGDDAAALEDIQRASRLRPEDSQWMLVEANVRIMRYNRNQTRDRDGELRAAASLLKRAADVDPGNARALELLVIISMRLNRADDARRAAARLLAVEPRNATALRTLSGNAER